MCEYIPCPFVWAWPLYPFITIAPSVPLRIKKLLGTSGEYSLSYIGGSTPMRKYTLKVPNNNICDLCLGCLLLILWFYPQPLLYLCSRPAHVDGQNGFDVFLSKITIMFPCFGLVTIQYVLFSFYCWVFCYFWHLIYFCVVIYLFMHGKKYESTNNPINPIHL